MKKIKNLNLFIVSGFIFLFSIFFITPVYASGSATVGFSGNSTVSVGSNITVQLYVSNVNDANGGVASFEGNLSFDSDYLEYVSGTGATTPYLFQINTAANYKIAALDTSLSNGIKSSGSTNVFTFVFKAKKEGSTTVSITNLKLTNSSERMTGNVSPKTITINTPAPVTKSSDATLKSLSATGYTLSPEFNKDITSYKIKVPATATTVSLQGSANHSKATVSGLGNINLTGDTTVATIKVTAEDGTVKNYTVTIEKEKTTSVTKSNDATLKSLDVSGFTLNPTFKSNVNTYSIRVNNNITGLKVTAIANSDKASVSISGNSDWKEGNNTITIKVTAEDGTVNNYIVNVNRASLNTTKAINKSSDNYLKSLIIQSSHEMKPIFDKNLTNYNITVPYEVSKLDLTATSNDSKAKVEIIGNSNFSVEKVNLVEVKVTAEDGSIRIYSLNVTRSTTSSKTDLKDLVIDNVNLSPKFDSNILDYTANVDAKTDKLNIRYTTSNSDSKVEIIGNDNLKEGNNTVLIKVTDKEGFTKYYSINVVKEKSSSTILGLKPLHFVLLIFIILLLIAIIIILLIKRKKDENKKLEEKKLMQTQPIIEVKPEFNFNSKNSSDDDVVHGNMSQNSGTIGANPEKKQIFDASYEDKIPYDPYDETVTKQELIDAIHEASEKKDVSKLQMLLRQEELNKMKKELKEKEDLEQKKEDEKWW